MPPAPDDRSEEESRDDSRPGHRRRSRSSRSKRYDQDSVDSGYEGSHATKSPQFGSRKLPGSGASKPAARSEGMPKQDDAGEGTGSGEDADSDSDYDPKARYYLDVDDADYAYISFQGGGAGPGEPNAAAGKSRDGEDDAAKTTRHYRSTSDRHRHSSRRRDSVSSSGSDTRTPRRHGGRSQRQPSRHDADSSRYKPRQDSTRRPLSPIFSDDDQWSKDHDPKHSPPHRTRGAPRSSRRRRASGAGFSDDGYETEPETISDEERKEKRRTSRSRGRSRAHGERSRKSKREPSEGGSPPYTYKPTADPEGDWLKSFKERLTKGVDMAQVRKVGFDAACVAAIKVAVGTQVPWKQRIPKTIAVGAAAALTDFMISKTSFKPKGLLGTIYVRQFVEIALANLIINPTSTKVMTKFGASKPTTAGQPAAMNQPAGGRARLGATATGNEGTAARGGGGRGRR